MYPNNYKQKRDTQILNPLHYEIFINKMKIIFELQKSINLVTKNTIIEYRKGNITNSILRRMNSTAENDCFYQGRIKQHKYSSAALSLCQGMVSILLFWLNIVLKKIIFQLGLFYLNETTYLIEPISDGSKLPKSEKMLVIDQPHVVYTAPNIKLNANNEFINSII